MIRTSCTHCHGVGFSIDALADEELILQGFTGEPSTSIDSIRWVLDHEQRTNPDYKNINNKTND